MLMGREMNSRPGWMTEAAEESLAGDNRILSATERAAHWLAHVGVFAPRSTHGMECTERCVRVGIPCPWGIEAAGWRSVECPWCGARPGTSCVVRQHNVVVRLADAHAARLEAVAA